MNDYEAKVRAFHLATGAATDEPFSVQLLELRSALLAEELKELQQEIEKCKAELEQKGTITKPAKANLMKEMADVQYVLSGMAVTFGLPADQVFSRVHDSNLSKFGDDGKPVLREDGKVLKGPNYVPPFLEDLA
jgi:predicted HAD superfamily Cof-like phosphohydrolase